MDVEPSADRVPTERASVRPALLDGVQSHPATVLIVEDDEVTAEMLRASGYRTAAWVDNPWLSRGFGFRHGFTTDDEHADPCAIAPIVIL